MDQPFERLQYFQAEPPAFGEPVEVAPGILWLRLPLPYALDHVNIYLIEDGAGWAVFDTGICDEPTVALWTDLLTSALNGRPVVKLVVSHFHPDHAGMVGWLHERFHAPLFMPQTEYFFSRLLQSLPPRLRLEEPVFYRRMGLDGPAIERMLDRGKSYLQRTSGLPPSYYRLLDGNTIELGGRVWQILTGGGHAPEQAMLWCQADRLFLAADQVLARISPNVSVVEMEPEGNPLALYLRSLARLQTAVGDAAFVLPGHDLPFTGVHLRLQQLIHHHEQRCQKLLAVCREQRPTCAEIVPMLFKRRMEPHTLGFALGETLAHVNYLLARGELAAEPDAGNGVRYRAA